MKITSYLDMSAEFSEGRTKRYWLERAWSLTNPRRLVKEIEQETRSVL